MPAEGLIVLDASVAAKLFFHEEGSDAARRILKEGAPLLAPDLLFVEMASLAVTRVRRGLSTPDEAAYAVKSVRALIDVVTPVTALCDRAFQLAITHGFSAYDSAYLVLAAAEGAVMLTADIRFARLAIAAGLAAHIQALEGP
jgi:predicted nucleic acid-binding protein